MPDIEANLKVCRIASLTLTNAMIFQQVLAERDTRVQSLSRAVRSNNVAESLLETWTFILEQIDYVPIFTTANEIAKDLVGVAGADSALKRLGEAALRITGKRAALRHDLMGRIYHRLLADAKYFGAFYTTVPAATILLKLTLDPADGDIDWADLDQIATLRIADLACGTGTLLKASLQTIVENHVRARAENGQLPDLRAVYKVLVEKVLWGLDVVPFAIHLAGSALALHEPDVEFGEMNLYTLPIGGPKDRLGSVELLTGRNVAVQADLFGAATAPARLTAMGELHDKIDVPQLNLCVMNPPFTRSVGGNLLFGHAPDDERKRMRTALKRLVSSQGVPANITAGLGSVFVATGHRLLNASGRMSLVLPRALLSGVAWTDTRLLLGNNYHVRYIIVSHEPGRWNFSENTALSECLIVADWVGGEGTTKPTKVVNIWTKPKSSVEALTVASLIRGADGTSLDAPSGSEELRTDTLKYGEVVQVPPADIARGNWNEGAAFAQTEMCRSAHYLWHGKIFRPGTGVVGKVPLTRLKEIADVGPDRRDIHDGFRPTDQETEYPAIWGHDTTTVQSMAQRPNKYLMALARAHRGRNLRDAHLLWTRSGRLLVAERLRLTTARLVAIRTSEKVLSNTWWPVATEGGGVVDKILALWLNSSLGLLSLIASRVDTEGAWVELKKPTLESLPIIDSRELSEGVSKKLCRAYDELCGLEIQALPQMAEDDIRKKIDVAIAESLGLKDDLSLLRRLLAAEPIISMQLPA